MNDGCNIFRLHLNMVSIEGTTSSWKASLSSVMHADYSSAYAKHTSTLRFPDVLPLKIFIATSGGVFTKRKLREGLAVCIWKAVDKKIEVCRVLGRGGSWWQLGKY